MPGKEVAPLLEFAFYVAEALAPARLRTKALKVDHRLLTNLENPHAKTAIHQEQVRQHLVECHTPAFFRAVAYKSPSGGLQLMLGPYRIAKSHRHISSLFVSYARLAILRKKVCLIWPKLEEV